MEKHQDCFICSEISFDEFNKLFDEDSLKVCEFHSKLTYAQEYCLRCNNIHGISPEFLAILCKEPKFAMDYNEAAGVIAIRTNCDICHKTSDDGMQFFYIRLAGAKKFKEPEFTDDAQHMCIGGC